MIIAELCPFCYISKSVSFKAAWFENIICRNTKMHLFEVSEVNILIQWLQRKMVIYCSLYGFKINFSAECSSENSPSLYKFSRLPSVDFQKVNCTWGICVNLNGLDLRPVISVQSNQRWPVASVQLSFRHCLCWRLKITQSPFWKKWKQSFKGGLHRFDVPAI